MFIFSDFTLVKLEKVRGTVFSLYKKVSGDYFRYIKSEGAVFSLYKK
jgi:hypothetical protein